jgi:hypothetical protein
MQEAHRRTPGQLAISLQMLTEITLASHTQRLPKPLAEGWGLAHKGRKPERA